MFEIPPDLNPALAGLAWLRGRWEGTGSIPVCVTGRMRWRARLHMQLEQTRIQADWVFEAPTSARLHRGNLP